MLVVGIDAGWLVSWFIGVTHLVDELIFILVSINIGMMILLSCWLVLVSVTTMLGHWFILILRLGWLNSSAKTSGILGQSICNVIRITPHVITWFIKPSQSSQVPPVELSSQAKQYILGTTAIDLNLLNRIWEVEKKNLKGVHKLRDETCQLLW